MVSSELENARSLYHLDGIAGRITKDLALLAELFDLLFRFETNLVACTAALLSLD
jgi:hypothetical protein